MLDVFFWTLYVCLLCDPLDCSLLGSSVHGDSPGKNTVVGSLYHWKRLWWWEGLGAGEEGDDRGWDGWMASPTRWTWVWANSRSSWWTGRPGVLQFMGLQRVRHDWVTELNWYANSQHFFITVMLQYIILNLATVYVGNLVNRNKNIFHWTSILFDYHINCDKKQIQEYNSETLL